jgi:hypothetical protein
MLGFLSRKSGADAALVYEKRLGSVSAMRRELESLDGDAGMRVAGRYGGVGCLAFVTRFGTVYTVMVYSVKGGRRGVPREKLATREYTSLEEVVALLRSISGPRVDACAY